MELTQCLNDGPTYIITGINSFFFSKAAFHKGFPLPCFHIANRILNLIFGKVYDCQIKYTKCPDKFEVYINNIFKYNMFHRIFGTYLQKKVFIQNSDLSVHPVFLLLNIAKLNEFTKYVIYIQ